MNNTSQILAIELRRESLNLKLLTAYKCNCSATGLSSGVLHMNAPYLLYIATYRENGMQADEENIIIGMVHNWQKRKVH